VGHGPVAHARQRGRATGKRSSAPITPGVRAARRLPPPGQATLRTARSRRGPEVRRAGSRRAHRELFFTIATRVVSVDHDLGWGQIGVPHWGHFQTPNTRAYIRRFSEEHTFRFLKQILNWTTPRVRHPAQADLWTWLVLAAYTQLRLAGACVQDQRLPSRTPPAGAPPLPLSRAPCLFRAVARRGHAGKRAKTLWSLARAAQRPSLRPGSAPPGPQEERLSPAASPQPAFLPQILDLEPTCSWLKRKVKSAVFARLCTLKPWPSCWRRCTRHEPRSWSEEQGSCHAACCLP